ncbi:MAG: hypothetical protein WCT52_01070 [Candidatus Micrarchaeia archaeon]|jgi:hypothetical protein
MAVKFVAPTDSVKNCGSSKVDEGRRKFLKIGGLVVMAAFTNKFSSIPLFAQDAKGIVKMDLDLISIKSNGNFTINGAETVVGDRILDAVTNNGERKISEAYLVNGKVYVIRFKFGMVVINDTNGATAHKAYANEISSFQVLQPDKGEAVRVQVGNEIITGRMIGSGNDKEIKLEAKAA